MDPLGLGMSSSPGGLCGACEPMPAFVLQGQSLEHVQTNSE